MLVVILLVHCLSFSFLYLLCVMCILLWPLCRYIAFPGVCYVYLFSLSPLHPPPLKIQPPLEPRTAVAVAIGVVCLVVYLVFNCLKDKVSATLARAALSSFPCSPAHTF